MTDEGRFKDKLARTWQFLSEDIWDIEITSLSVWHRWGVKVVRVLHLVFKGFKQDECPLHASALTFSTLMALIPILALSLALAKGLGDEELTKNRIRGAINGWTQTFSTATTNHVDLGTNTVPVVSGSDDDGLIASQPPAELGAQINRLVDDVFEKVENINFKALSGVGLILLIWMVIQVLGRVEGSFNRVWGVPVGRPVWRRFTDYLSIIFVLPLLIAAASSLPIADFATRFLPDDAAFFVRRLLGSGVLKNLTVFIMTGLSFTFLLMFVPNTRVKTVPGLTGGFVAGILFLLWLTICAAIQVGAARYGRIYGSFAIVPILLAWVFVSWEIVLFGAETAFAVQNCTTYQIEQGSRNASLRTRATLALSVLMETAGSMINEPSRFKVAEYARDKHISVRLLQGVIRDLIDMGILAEVADQQGQYVLLKAPSALYVKDVLDKMVELGVRPEAVGVTDLDPALSSVLKRVDSSIASSIGDVTVEQLVRTQPPQTA